MSQLEIVSDGTAQGTVVRLRDGSNLQGVISVEIEPLRVGQTVRARITIDRVALQIRVPNAGILCTVEDRQASNEA